MVTGEETVKGIIISCFPQGEYGKRLLLLTDKYGKITAFATGAAKQGSKIIGAIRPFTCAEFTLREGKGARNVHGISVMDAFEEISLDPEICFYGSYVLETAGYFSKEGMEESDAKKLLNLIFLTLSALRDKKIPAATVRKIYELRLLFHEGVYSSVPEYQDEMSTLLWNHVLGTPLSKLYDPLFWEMNGRDTESFTESVRLLFSRQVQHRFNSAELL